MKENHPKLQPICCSSGSAALDSARVTMSRKEDQMRSTDQSKNGSAMAFVCMAALIVCMAAGCTGGGESVISGLGNSDNHIGTAALWGSLADELADYEATPRVSDEDLQLAYAAIRRHALEGELEAVLVLLKLAEEQRESEE